MIATDWIPAIIIGAALVIFSIYLLITKNITALIGMQVVYLKTAHDKVANVSGGFLFMTGVLTFLLPVSEQLNGVCLIVNLSLLVLIVIALFWYLYKQKVK